MSKANIDFAQHNSGATWRLGYFLLFAVLVAFGLYVAFVAGPVYRATTQQQLAQAVADEDRGFSERFGMRAGTPEFEPAASTSPLFDRTRLTGSAAPRRAFCSLRQGGRVQCGAG
jgi:hypothetical protein